MRAAVEPRHAAVRFDRRLAVVVAENASDPEEVRRVARAVSESITKRGLNVAAAERADHGDLLVDVRYAVRAGAVWGGIPSREVLLEYHLLDVREEEPLASGSEFARFAEPSAREAMMGALQKASERLADQIVRTAASLPPPYRSPPPEANAWEPSAPGESLACLPFRNTTGRTTLDGWCETLSSIAADVYQQSERYKLLERARLREIVEDSDVAAVLGGRSDAARRIGGELGVHLLLVGEVAVRPDGNLVVSARLVRADTAEVEHVIIVAGSANQVDRLEADFRRGLARPTIGWIAERRERLYREPMVWPREAP